MHNINDPKVLPIKNGVKPSCVVMPSEGGGSVLSYLLEKFPAISENEWVRRIELGEVVDETGRIVQIDTGLLKGLRVYYYRTVENEPNVPFEENILFENNQIVVADKPHFLPVVPGGHYLQNTLLVRLKKKLNCPDLSPVHRIDRDTAGLVLFSKNRSERGAYQALFRERSVKKLYEAIAPWKPSLNFPRWHESRIVESGNFIRMEEVSGPVNSQTYMEIVEHNRKWARYHLQPINGKRHQLRVHMASLGLGLKGDGLYPLVVDLPEGDFSRPMMLLAKRLDFLDPITQIKHSFQSQRILGDLPE